MKYSHNCLIALGTDKLLSCVENQTFLPFHLEAAFSAQVFIGWATWGYMLEVGDLGAAAFWAFLGTSVTLGSFSVRGSYLHLISVALRLLVSGGHIYLEFFDQPKNPMKIDRVVKIFMWIVIDPLVWIVELALFFRLEHPVFLAIWSVRRATMTGALLKLGLDEKEPRTQESRHMQRCFLSVGAVMIVHIILNLSEEDHYVTLGTILFLSINHLLGNSTERNADDVFQNDFMIPFIILTFVRALKRN